jgi:hypothetical protein
MYNIFVILIFLVLYGHDHLGFFCLFEVYLINLKLNLINFFKNPTNNEKLEYMEYICEKLLSVTKFEKIAYILQN